MKWKQTMLDALEIIQHHGMESEQMSRFLKELETRDPATFYRVVRDLAPLRVAG